MTIKIDSIGLKLIVKSWKKKNKSWFESTKAIDTYRSDFNMIGWIEKWIKLKIQSILIELKEYHYRSRTIFEF